MLQHTRGIVLHQIKYSDNSLIVYIYTQAFGRLAFLVNGAYSKKARISAKLLQPLYLVELVADYKNTRNIQRIRELNPFFHFAEIPYNIFKRTIAIFLAEVVYKTVREEEKNTALFDFLFHAIQYLDLSNQNITDFHLLFLLRLSKHLGLYPRNNFSAQLPVFDMLAGEFCSHEPQHQHFLGKELSPLFFRLLNHPIDKSLTIALNKHKRGILLDKTLEYFALHIEGIGKIKSLVVLKDVFG